VSLVVNYRAEKDINCAHIHITTKMETPLLTYNVSDTVNTDYRHLTWS